MVPPVRVSTADDAGEIGRLLHEFNAEFGVASPGVEVLVTRLRELLTLPDVLAIVAPSPEAANLLIGIGLVTRRRNVWHAGWLATLDELYLDPLLRGRGVGSSILEVVQSESLRSGVDAIEINVDEGDVDAQRFYKRHGFSAAEPDTGEKAFYFFRELVKQ